MWFSRRKELFICKIEDYACRNDDLYVPFGDLKLLNVALSGESYNLLDYGKIVVHDGLDYDVYTEQVLVSV